MSESKRAGRSIKTNAQSPHIIPYVSHTVPFHQRGEWDVPCVHTCTDVEGRGRHQVPGEVERWLARPMLTNRETASA